MEKLLVSFKEMRDSTIRTIDAEEQEIPLLKRIAIEHWWTEEGNILFYGAALEHSEEELYDQLDSLLPKTSILLKEIQDLD